MLMACGAALNHSRALIEGLQVDRDRMDANLEAANGLVLAEAASFALSRHLSRAEAQALVKEACQEVARTGKHLMDVLAATSDAPVDWAALKDPADYTGMAADLIERALNEEE